jgi:RNA polymerase sigma factor (sigma-70 family)
VDVLIARWTALATEDVRPDALGSGRVRTAAIDFDTLYRSNYRDVYRFALGLTRSADDAADITAETFERAFRAWSGGVSPPDRPQPWLLLTARRIATDRWHRARRLAAILQRVAHPERAPEGLRRWARDRAGAAMGCVERAAERAHLLGQRVNTRLKVADRSRYIAGNVRKLAGGLAGNGVDVNEEARQAEQDHHLEDE